MSRISWTAICASVVVVAGMIAALRTRPAEISAPATVSISVEEARSVPSQPEP